LLYNYFSGVSKTPIVIAECFCWKINWKVYYVDDLIRFGKWIEISSSSRSRTTFFILHSVTIIHNRNFFIYFRISEYCGVQITDAWRQSVFFSIFHYFCMLLYYKFHWNLNIMYTWTARLVSIYNTCTRCTQTNRSFVTRGT